MNPEVKGIKLFQSSSGFTLLELVLATLISSLVIGILSVSLGFSLRMWERQQRVKSNEAVRILDIMRLQMASFSPVPIEYEDDLEEILFTGDRHSLALATDYSVKALSKGVPVIARYVYVPGKRTLYYAEMPLDPYNAEPVRDFLRLSPGTEGSWPRFYPVEIGDFSISYVEEETGDVMDSWEDEVDLPRVVLVKWSSKEDSTVFTHRIVPNFLFSMPVE